MQGRTGPHYISNKALQNRAKDKKSDESKEKQEYSRTQGTRMHVYVYHVTFLQWTPFNSSSAQLVQKKVSVTVGFRRMFLCMNRFVFRRAEAFTPWFYSYGPYSICYLSKNLSLVCQTLFIHLWNRLSSSEECWCVEKLHQCTLLLYIPEEMEKRKLKNVKVL